MNTGVFAVRSFLSSNREASKCPEGLLVEVAFMQFPEPGKEAATPQSLGKSVPGKGNGKCKVFNFPEDSANFPELNKVWLAGLGAPHRVEVPKC